jgi:hypothetical protein
MINKHRLLLFSFLFFLCSFAFAQTAAEMDAMLQAETISAARLARFALGAADLLPQELSGPAAESAAYDMAFSNGWIKTAATDAVTLKAAAFLIMKAFNLKGGAMYSLFKNPRYAYREMVYKKLIQGQLNQAMNVSGPMLLVILDRTLNYSGGSN